MKNRKYPIAFSITNGEFSKEYLENNDLGGCDAIIIHSIIYPPDGSRSTALISIDGRDNKTLNSLEIFKSFCDMAAMLSKDEDLPLDKRLFCKQILERIREALGVNK